MYHDLPRSARFRLVLFAIDRDLAETVRREGCSCGGHLHSANYLRKPRGTPAGRSAPERSYVEAVGCRNEAARWDGYNRAGPVV
jgi:hypothetical protein